MTTAINNYVQNLYKNVLLRNAEAGGLAGWDSAAVGGLTSMSMVKGFIASAEAQNITALLRLYDVFFNRAADSAGLSGWLAALKGGTSLHDIATAFSGSSEFQTTHAAHSTAQYVEALYGNIFARASDAPGLAYWVQTIDKGSMPRADVALAFTLSAEAKSEAGAATRFAESYLALRSAGVEEPPTAVVETLSQESLDAAITELQTVHGKVQNGILQGADVFRDGNGDGLPDTDTSTVITDAAGNFTLVGGYGDILVTGGTDLTTGKTNDKILSALEEKAINSVNDLGGVTMVTPLTTIIKAMTDSGMNVETAVSKLNLALGLDEDFNPLTFDHTAAALNADSTEAEQKAAIAIKGAIAEVTAIMENSAGLIKGAAGTQTNLNAGAITANVAQALADRIIAATTNIEVGTPSAAPLVELESQAFIEAIITAAATSASADSDAPISVETLASIANLASDAAQIIGQLNDTIKGSVDAINGAAVFDDSKIIDAFSAIAKSEALGQDTIQNAITTAAAGGNLAQAIHDFSGTRLSTAITQEDIGEISDGVESTEGGSVLSDALDNAGLPPAPPPPPPSSGGGGPAPDTTAPTLTSSSPVDDAPAVAVGSNIVLTFSENVVAGTGDIVIKDGAGNSVHTIPVDNAQVTISGNQVAINPDTDLETNNTYYVQMASGVIKDAAGNAYAGIANTTTLNFSTPDTIAPTLTANSPVDNATAVAVGSNVVLTFSENVTAGTGDIVISNGTGDSRTIAVSDAMQVTISGNQVTINPAIDLNPITIYSVRMASGVIKDTAGNAYAGIADSAFDFTTQHVLFIDGTSASGHYATIQAAVTAAVNGDTIKVAAGTYTQASTLNVNKSLTLVGAGEGQTTIDARTVSGYGINVSADNVSLSGFTLNGPMANASTSYGIKVSPGGAASSRLHDFTITDVTSRGAGKAELDLNGVDRALIDHVTADGAPVGSVGTTAGAGIQLTDSANITISNSTTQNNLWGGIALYQANRSYDQQVNNITISDNNLLNEANPLYLQDESATNGFGALNLPGFSYAVRNASTTDSAQYTWMQATLPNANSFAANLPNPGSSTVQVWNGTVPTLASSSPSDDATAVAVGSNIVLTFSENVFAGSGDIVISDGTDEGTLNIPVGDTTQVTISGNQVTINPTDDLNPNTPYSVLMAAGVLTDATGNAYAGIADTTTLNFTTHNILFVGNGGYATIQGAVNAAVNGDTILVAAGNYNENVTVNKSITLLSVDGRDTTTITGNEGGAQLGAVVISSGVNNVRIGDAGQGFTIIGINGNGAIEKASVYIAGNHDMIAIAGNRITANGDAGLITESGATVTHLSIDGSIFDGQTFTGSAPDGTGFNAQFVPGNNAPRQLVVIGNGGGGAGPANYPTKYVSFTNNDVTGTAGGVNGGGEQGNTLITIDADQSTISGNNFTGFTNRFGEALRARGPNTTVTNNTIDHGPNSSETTGFTINNKGYPATYSGNIIAGGPAGASLTGTPGNDQISGGTGNDSITGGAGADTITLVTGVFAATDTIVIGNTDSGITVAAADRITGFTAANDALKMGTAGDATAGTGTYVEATAAVANFGAALTAANTALAILTGTSLATELYSFQWDGTNGYLFDDIDENGDADQVVVLVGITGAGIAAGDIIA